MIDFGLYCLPGHEVHQKPVVLFYHSFRDGFVRVVPHKSADAFNALTFTASTS